MLSLEELGLFPCSRPTAKVRALIFGLFQMRIHPYGGRLISNVVSKLKVI